MYLLKVTLSGVRSHFLVYVFKQFKFKPFMVKTNLNDVKVSTRAIKWVDVYW